MPDPVARPRLAVLSSSWARKSTESAFVMRSIAGALSRHADVDVLVPGERGPALPDGLFDVLPLGIDGPGHWPEPAPAEWPGLAPAAVLIEGNDRGAVALARLGAPGAAVLAVAFGGGVPPEAVAVLTVGAPSGDTGGAPAGPGALPRPGPALLHDVGLHVPVNPLAAERRHIGLGITGYVLVLSDRPGRPEPRDPAPAVAWLTARFPADPVVVVEGATASVWTGRALRGTITVDTRTDLWRLLAHARTTVDLAPGPLVARECVESLRYGTPIVVPARTPAADLAAEGGGLWYADTAEMLDCVASVADPAIQASLGTAGRERADSRYGDADRFVALVGEALEIATGDARGPLIPRVGGGA